jgi:LysR family transcriptional regulator, hydrogen peroxide-inducible genes activator
MNLRDLEYLVAVADHRHFGRAAAACHVSQPTLSTQLKKLESELGAQLVERTSRTVLLTSVGEAIVTRARRMLSDAGAIRAVATRARRPRAGWLRLGIFPTLAPYLLPHVVPLLHQQFPDLELLLTEEKSPWLLSGLQSGKIDAAVLALPVDDPTLEHLTLFREDFVLAVPVGHRLAQQPEPLPPSAVSAEHLLLLGEGHCLRDQALSWCHSIGADEYSGFQATSLETLRHMVASGVGMTLLPQLSVVPPVAPSPQVRLLRFAEPVPFRDLALVFRPSTVFRDLMPELAVALRQLPPGLVHQSGEESTPSVTPGN